MENKRIGNTLVITWKVNVLTGTSLSDYELMLVRNEPNKKVNNIPFEIKDGNALVFKHEGIEQKVCGQYTYTLYVNYGKTSQSVVDSCDGYFLVHNSCVEGSCGTFNVQNEIELKSVILMVGGMQGKSAYEVAVDNGFEGTEEQWLESLKGIGVNIKGELASEDELPADGLPSDSYIINGDLYVYVGENGNVSTNPKWSNVGTIRGEKGKSAYEIAVEDGFEGSETEWLESLKGKDGKPFTYEDLTPEQISELQKPATEAAKLANSAAQSANTSAENANQAALDANRAAEAANTAATEANRTNEAIQTAEGLRVQSEKARETAETQRVQNEQTRQTAETQRVKAEEARVTEFATLKQNAETATQEANDAAVKANQAAENVEGLVSQVEQAVTSAEQAATSATEAAANAEKAVQDAQSAIDTANALNQSVSKAESEREIAENDRKLAEQSRVSAETQRQTSFAQMESDIATLKQEGSEAVENANSAATSANDAAEAAQTSASNANQAALDANRAAEAANTAATEANRTNEAIQTAEALRVQSEKARETAETQRQNNEQTRQTKEGERQTAETEREKTFAEYEQRTNNAVSDAEQALKDANTAIDNVNAAAEAVNGRITDIENQIDYMEQQGNALTTDIAAGKQMLAAAITNKGVLTTATDSFEQMANNIGKIYKGAYDEFLTVKINNNYSSPEVERDGSAFFSNWLEDNIQNAMLKDGILNYYLDRENSRKKKDGSDAVIDGSDGDIMIILPKFWYSFVETVVGFEITYSHIPQTSEGWKESPEIWVGASEGVIETTGGKDYLRSCFNLDTTFRGGNGSNWDALPKSLLGMPRTQKSHDAFRVAAANKINNGEGVYHQFDYRAYKKLWLMYLAVYGTRNIQDNYSGIDLETGEDKRNEDGFKYGGLGRGVADCGSWWNSFNGQNPFVRTDVSYSLGCQSGVVDYTVNIGTFEQPVNQIVQVPILWGIANPYGHIFKAVDGITKQVIESESGKIDRWGLYDDPNVYTSSGQAGAREVVDIPQVNSGYIKKMDKNFLPLLVGGSESSYWADFLYSIGTVNNYAVFNGGAASTGGYCGLGCVRSSLAVGHAGPDYGGRLCFSPA